jgi:hypothetical protein
MAQHSVITGQAEWAVETLRLQPSLVNPSNVSAAADVVKLIFRD